MAQRIACQASIPPDGATCTSEYCRSVAVVRLLAHRNANPADYCELHWPGVAGSLAARGVRVADTTGDLDVVKDHFPQWHIWTGSSGRIYATVVLVSQAAGGRGDPVSTPLAPTRAPATWRRPWAGIPGRWPGRGG